MTGQIGGPYTGIVGVPVTFNGSGSSDPDFDMLIYSWNFGDGGTGTGVSPIYTFASAGEYTITLVVNDGTVNSEPATTTATISVTEVPTIGDMHVNGIDVTYTVKKAGKNTFYTGVAKVTVVDASGQPVEGVTVYGHWSGLTQDSDSGITNASGMVTVTSDSVKVATGTFTFTIDNFAKSGWNYDSEANVINSSSVSIP